MRTANDNRNFYPAIESAMEMCYDKIYQIIFIPLKKMPKGGFAVKACMRWILLSVTIIAAVCLFSACSGSQNSKITETETEASETTTGEDSSQPDNEDSLSSLSDLFLASEGSKNLRLYSGDALNDLSYPEFLLCGDRILFYDADYSESEGSLMNFLMFDPETGEMVSTAQYECEFLTDICRTDAGILFSDSALGRVILMDETLTCLQELSFVANYEYWYLGTDGETLYQIDDGSLLRVNLADGDTAVLLSSSVSLYGSSELAGGANISYIDEESQLSLDAWLDLSSGSLTYASFDEPIGQIFLSGETWLVSLEDTKSQTYLFGEEDSLQAVELAEGDLTLVTGSEYLLYTEEDAATGQICYNLYDNTGSCLSSCTFDGEDLWAYGNYCVYSDTYGGIFFIVYQEDSPDLYFWDITAESEGEDLAAISLEEYEQTPEGTAVDASLYERAEEIGGIYGVEILIADQCETDYGDFTAEQEIDEALIEAGLTILEDTLADYPEGFLAQLKYDKITGIRINLCGTMTPVNENWGEESYNGLTQESGNRCVITFDLNQLQKETVWHELSHVIDAKLSWDSYCREDALFSEEAWASLNPDGFEYEYVYSGFLERSFEGQESQYFIDVYSMVSPTEDRARILEYAMAGFTWYFSDGGPIYEKFLYYCECIEEVFGTEGWPTCVLDP